MSIKGSQKMPHLLVAGQVHEAGLQLLRAQSTVTWDYIPEMTHEAYAPFIDKADGLVVRTQPVPAETIARAPLLKIVSRHGVGYDAVDVTALNARKIPLAIVGDVNSRAVAEHGMMLLLALAKKVTHYDKAVRSNHWASRNVFDAVELSGKNLLIVGFGRIGRHAAKMAAGFGLNIFAYDPGIGPEELRAGGVEPVRELHHGLAQADFITLHAAMTGTTPLIGHKEFLAMKDGAMVINTARGGLIDENALIAALQSGRLSGAGIDVFQDEPPSANHPLFSRQDVILSPHLASLTQDSAIKMATVSIQNALDCFDGRLNLALVVNRDAIGFAA
jgi:D-3-phosphoglycerate dehydrogenase / 2-oxoglutarate reductase